MRLASRSGVHKNDGGLEVENTLTQDKVKERDGSEQLHEGNERLPFQTTSGAIVSYQQPM